MRELVNYLNTLHRLNGSNINTTAEAGLVNKKYASQIIVKDEALIDSVIEALENNGKVLLTGFAGDGKTTLAKLVADELTGADVDFSETVITFSAEEKKYVVIKDLSEISQDKASDLILSQLMAPDTSLLLVSNTGSIRTRLLDIYDHNHWHEVYRSKASFEAAILKGIECNSETAEGNIEIGSIMIHTFNLVKRDNLKTAKQVLRKMLDLDDWNTDDEEEKNSVIHLNVSLMKANDYLAVDRMFYIYRKMYEYGTRLTMRNLIEHFAYTITGNRNSFDKSYSNYIFFDNFFGVANPFAAEIEAIKCLNRYSFGNDVPSVWKRRIWNGIGDDKYPIQMPGEVQKIDRFAKLFSRESYLNCYYSLKDQSSVLRSVFFLNDVEEESFHMYLASFLNSPAFWYFMENQEKQGSISRKTIKALDRILKRVMRDYCSGLRMQSDKTESNDNIYITMARKSKFVNQSTQIVLGVFSWDSNHIEIKTVKDSRDIYQYYLNLKNNSNTFDNRMVLNLPLLDYISQIDAGSPLEDRESIFQKRLENIKLMLLNNSPKIEDDCIFVVYKDIQNKVNKVQYFIEDNQIDVE